MSGILDPFILLKVACAIVVVVSASRAAERLGPFFGSLVATLPVSTGPIYVFLAIDHGAQFISDSALMGVAGVPATVAFVAVHALVAQRCGTFLSWLAATAAWWSCAVLLQLRHWSFAEACALFAVVFAGAILALRRFVLASAPPPVPRVRFDLALRALLVACVVVGTTLASHLAGPTATGVLATYPVVFTSLVLILQPRWGGPFVASLLVNSLKGLVGFGSALAVLHLSAARISAGWALLLALCVAIGWNCALLYARQRTAR